MNIAFNINKLALIGLGVTLNSLLINCSAPEKLKFYFLCSELDDADKENINQFLRDKNLQDGVILNFDAKDLFGHLKSLHGDWTTYGRLLLSEYIKEDTVLYLDSDLVITLDVLKIENFDFSNNPIAAVNSGSLGTTLENHFYCNVLKLNTHAPTFNAGIIFFNLKKWRERSLKEICLTFGKEHSKDLKSADQTILNGLFYNEFAYLPYEFNVAWYVTDKVLPMELSKKCIFHFVGSPKPWDIFSKYIHSGYDIWNSYLDNKWREKYYRHNWSDLVRFWKIRKSFIRHLYHGFISKN